MLISNNTSNSKWFITNDIFLDNVFVNNIRSNEYIPVYEDYLDLAEYVDEDNPHKIVVTLISSTPAPHIFHSLGPYIEILNSFLILSILAYMCIVYSTPCKFSSISNCSSVNSSTQTENILICDNLWQFLPINDFFFFFENFFNFILLFSYYHLGNNSYMF